MTSFGDRCAGTRQNSRPLARPRQHFSSAGAPDIIEMAALYTAGVVRNHPFVDGNKRIGHAALETFLLLNGFELVAGFLRVALRLFAFPSRHWVGSPLA
jgi:prophage maintenance system killer protein